MSSINNKTIAIVGGGPGGLTLARLLQMNGANVKVYDRDLNKDARVQGATLDLHEESGLHALHQAGLMDAFNANYRPGADALRIADKDANILWDDDATPREETNRPEIDRGPLRKILLESLQPDTVVWDSNFVSLTPEGNGWKLHFKNGTSAIADIVIGADGANSKIRPYITPIKAFFAGMTAIEGAVYNAEVASPKIYKLLNDGKIFAMGDSKSFIVSSKGDGSMTFYPGFNSTENWSKNSGIDFNDKAQVLAWFKQEFTGWDEVWQEVFENAEPKFIPRPQYCMPLDQTWEALPNLTMLGDAAHLMPPYAGEGVNMAMLDAVELAECLLNDSYTDTKSAIAAYEKQMRKRASEIAAITLESTAALHSPGAINYLISIISGSQPE
ncbi:NAD(P)/FAD-dependent oxidoreductase [Mucilaginibacter sp. L196]|uniref:FAD-dependent oxidoreductase n=1 Tax=Mucilaginibacter sp. L196 TaxID=1641870 RepID=UPI00131AE33E|nr:NAD(P)/FAD-dependent oxidoreductase [Mucilaginibacter sp. L196]